ncbi:Fc receptor-like protein 5 isoform X1 [Patagioenas fasciata]|uniref:Fc receptor-like protein 5 isoform X1 n=1 Tax=Patagioenas fasciata TaxID=372321 RepID=UPI003A98E5C9
MGTLLLMPLLASLQFFPLASPTDPPPPPTITVTPEKLEYIMGDTISLRCSAPSATKEKIQGFHFLGTSGWAVDARVRTESYVYTFTIAGPRDSGAHTCTYSILTPARRYLRSRESKPIVISVRDLPPPPTLTLTPAGGVTVEGQPLVFLCRALAGEALRRFHFYKDEVEVTEGTQLTSGETEAQLKVTAAGMGLSGNVTCGYEEETEGRWVPSYPSQTHLLLITEAAAAPHLSVDPPTLVVPQDAPLGLTCEASRAAFTMSFHFYRNGAKMGPGPEGSVTKNWGNSSHFYIPRTPLGFGGNFSCTVEENVGGTWVEGPPSNMADITVSAQFPFVPLFAGCAGGVAVLLLLLPLTVWLWRRRRGGASWKGFRNKDDSGGFSLANVGNT